MYFERLDGNKLRVRLTAEDLEEFLVTYDGMDYADSATRMMVSEILSRARLECGFTPGDGRLLIEAYPGEEDGCTLLFTAVPPPGRPALGKGGFGPLVYAFEDIDTVIDGSVRLFRLCCHRIYKSSLYRMDKGYRMILYPLDRTGSRASTLLAEYGELAGEGPAAAAVVEEHGAPVILGKAIDKLSYYFARG